MRMLFERPANCGKQGTRKNLVMHKQVQVIYEERVTLGS